jgi:hypothetical protein
MKRIIDSGAVFSFYNRHFILLVGKNSVLPPPKTQITVLVSPHFGIKVQYHNTLFEVLPYIKPAKTPNPKQTSSKKAWTPPDSHYYKYGHSLIKKVSFEDSDRDILHMLETIFLRQYA